MPAGREGRQGAGSVGTRAEQPRPLLTPATVSGACGHRAAAGGHLGGASSPGPSAPACPGPPSAPHSLSMWAACRGRGPWLSLCGCGSLPLPASLRAPPRLLPLSMGLGSQSNS